MGIGNPATAVQPVVFDDDNLQQAFDVGTLIRYSAAKRFAVVDGWTQVAVQLVRNLAGFAQSTIDLIPQMQADFPGEYESSDIFWIYNIGAYTVSTGVADDIADASVLLEYPQGAQYEYVGASGQPFLIWLAERWVSFVSTAQGVGATYVPIRKPIPIPAGAALQFVVQNTAATNTTTTFALFGRMLPRGVTPE